MGGVFNNYGNTVVFNQVQGTLVIEGRNAGNPVHLTEQLELIQGRLIAEKSLSIEVYMEAFSAITDLRQELLAAKPRTDVLRRALDGLEGVSVIAGLVGKLREFVGGCG